MPLARYFIYVGGALLGLLFVANWYWQDPSLPTATSDGSPIDKTILRIRSERKWPQKVELDTTTPIVVPPLLPTAETAETTIPPAPRPTLDALAQANPPQKQVAKRKPMARARYRNPNGAGERRFAVNPMPPAWPAGW